jgi:hypothetical protein
VTDTPEAEAEATADAIAAVLLTLPGSARRYLAEPDPATLAEIMPYSAAEALHQIHLIDDLWRCRLTARGHKAAEMVRLWRRCAATLGRVEAGAHADCTPDEKAEARRAGLVRPATSPFSSGAWVLTLRGRTAAACLRADGLLA